MSRLTSLSILTTVLAAFGVHVAPSEVEAQATHGDDAALRQRARNLTSQAEHDYLAGRFEPALRGYQRAYQVVPEPALLFNLGQCHRRLQRPLPALQYFEAYLRERPDAPERALVEGLIAEQRSALSSPGIPAQNSSLSLRVMSPSPAEARARRVDTGDGDRDDTALYERWWFWTGVAAVATGIAVATVVAVGEQPDRPMPGSLGTVRW